MPRRTTPQKFRRRLIAIAASAALAPASAWALDLANSPPGTVEPYVAPNVILSLDDSTSMDVKDMIKDTKTRTEVLQDALNEVFNDTSLLPDKKIRLAWQSLGDCTSVDGLTFTKLGTSAASSSAANTMKILDETHRSNFIKYIKNYDTCTSTPTHKMVKRADEYMRAPLDKNGPWASIPGEELNGPNGKPLGCRRNYHILLTDGGWNGDYFGPEKEYFGYKDFIEKTNWDDPKEDINTDPINFDNQDSVPFQAYGKRSATPAKTGTNQLPDPLGIDPHEDPKEYPGFILPDGTHYSRENKNTWIYRDIDFLTHSSWHEGYRPCRSYNLKNTGSSKNPKWVKRCTDTEGSGDKEGLRGGIISTLSDWTFKSWSTRLQAKNDLDGELSPLPEYIKASPTETFKNPTTGKTATLEKYWNPRYNPATWAHMSTFTIGFSKDSLPSKQYRPMGSSSQTAENIGKYWREGTTGAKNDWGSTTGLFYYLSGPSPADNSDSSTDNGNNGNLITPSSTMPYGYDGSFADYASGRAQWYSIKQEQEDMWHAAINGRGQFYAVEKGEDLKKAFEQIIRTINTEVSPSITSTALSGSNISRSGVSKFTGNYEPQSGWKGFVIAETVDTDGGVTLAWGGENTANKLDALASHESRVILSWSDQWVNAAPKGGVPFVWATDQSNLSTSQKLALQKATDGSVKPDTGWEGKNTADRLDDLASHSSRVILSWNDASQGGVPFMWDNLSDTQKLALQKATNGTDQGTTAGKDRLNYIRGERSKEGTEPNNYPPAPPTASAKAARAIS